MIEPGKLNQLSGGQKRRKLALTFGALERDILGIAEKNFEYKFKNLSRSEYVKTLLKIVLKDPELNAEQKNLLQEILNAKNFDERKACNLSRNFLLSILKTFPAEWDLIIAPHNTQNLKNQNSKNEISSLTATRDFFSGLYIFAEDIRSPFNLGAIFRTAEAMGAEKIFLSPLCTNPNHPRAIRSAMGCIETMPYKRISLQDLLKNLPKNFPIFVLETGGTPIQKFEFPKKGICIIGSEELGASPEAIRLAKNGCVTIKMKGLKASLNVAVAFGILMQKWTEAICAE